MCEFVCVYDLYAVLNRFTNYRTYWFEYLPNIRVRVRVHLSLKLLIAISADQFDLALLRQVNSWQQINALSKI